MSFVRELIDCIEPLGGQNSRVWAEIKSNRYSIGNSVRVTHARNSRGWVHTWQAGNRHKRFTFADAALNARCSRALLLRALADRERCTRRPWAGAAQKVRLQSRNALTRTLCIESRSPASVRRASTRADGHLMMGCGRERRAAANERLQHSGATQPPLSTQRAASCAQRCPTYHPVHVRFMLCASCADVMDKRYRGDATKLMCWRPLNVM